MRQRVTCELEHKNIILLHLFFMENIKKICPNHSGDSDNNCFKYIVIAKLLIQY